MGQEIALLVGYTLVITLRDRVEWGVTNISLAVCAIITFVHCFVKDLLQARVHPNAVFLHHCIHVPFPGNVAHLLHSD